MYGVCITGTVVTRQFWNAYFHSKPAITWLAPSLSMAPHSSSDFAVWENNFFSMATFGNVSLLSCFTHQKGSLGDKATHRGVEAL